VLNALRTLADTEVTLVRQHLSLAEFTNQTKAIFLRGVPCALYSHAGSAGDDTQVPDVLPALVQPIIELDQSDLWFGCGVVT